MTSEKQRITDDSDLKRYRTELPNMADDEMDAFQYRLYGHYKRVGTCTESVRTTAKRTKMSVGMVVQTRDWLHANGWITVEDPPDLATLKIRVIDRWMENMTRYDKSVHAMNKRSPHEHQRSPGEPKKKPIKKEPSKKDSSGEPERKRNRYFDLVCEAGNLDPAHLPPETSGSGVGKVVSELKKAKWTEADLELWIAKAKASNQWPLKIIYVLPTEMAKKDWRNGNKNPDTSQEDTRAREAVRKILAEKKARGE